MLRAPGWPAPTDPRPPTSHNTHTSRGAAGADPPSNRRRAGGGEGCGGGQAWGRRPVGAAVAWLRGAQEARSAARWGAGRWECSGKKHLSTVRGERMAQSSSGIAMCPSGLQREQVARTPCVTAGVIPREAGEGWGEAGSAGVDPQLSSMLVRWARVRGRGRAGLTQGCGVRCSRCPAGR